MAKRVRYNGGKETYLYSSNPKVLVVGKEYEVVCEEDLKFQTNYVLRGVEGEFNSVWFDEVHEKEVTQKSVFIAVSENLPKTSERYCCSKVEFIDGKPKLVRCTTSPVKEVKYVGNNTYFLETLNNTYIVKVDVSK